MIDMTFWKLLVTKWTYVRTETEMAKAIDTIKAITESNETTTTVGSLIDELFEEFNDD